MLQQFFGRWGRHMFAAFVFASCIAAAAVVSGCTSIAASAISPRVGPELAIAVGRYCADLTQSERELVRSNLNAQLAPHHVAITCAGDDPVSSPSSRPLLLEIPLPSTPAPSSEPVIVHLRL